MVCCFKPLLGAIKNDYHDKQCLKVLDEMRFIAFVTCLMQINRCLLPYVKHGLSNCITQCLEGIFLRTEVTAK